MLPAVGIWLWRHLLLFRGGWWPAFRFLPPPDPLTGTSRLSRCATFSAGDVLSALETIQNDPVIPIACHISNMTAVSSSFFFPTVVTAVTNPFKHESGQPGLAQSAFRTKDFLDEHQVCAPRLKVP